ncbi:hypothetical protein Q5530_25435 [Saccharothrix sp. BKS2]|uniref:hypothetical protein n=1 Tax=Saccharothrix sp. BKS2 TaxID=3064400 RepID=UPI0039E764AF
MSDESRHAASALRRDLGDALRAPDPRAWFDANHERVVDVLRAAVDEPEAAAALLAEVWPAVPADADEDWCRALHEVGARLAEALPTSLVLAAAFRRGARALRAKGLLPLAAAQGMRELAVHRTRDDDPAATADALRDLAATYRAQGRVHRVVGCADEALETFFRHGDRVGAARALTHLGELMTEVGRLDAAVRYLTRADRVFGEVAAGFGAETNAGAGAGAGAAVGAKVGAAGGAGANAADRAAALAPLGRALWLSGDRAAAHRAFNRALALLIGVDDAAAQRVRDLAAELELTPGTG